MPARNTEAMNLQLAEIAEMVPLGAHAVLVIDRAGGHLLARLTGRSRQHHHSRFAASKIQRAQPDRELLAIQRGVAIQSDLARGFNSAHKCQPKKCSPGSPCTGSGGACIHFCSVFTIAKLGKSASIAAR